MSIPFHIPLRSISALIVYILVFMLNPACAEEPQSFDHPQSLNGRYQVVSMRTDSSTASTLSIAEGDTLIGTYLEIDEDGFHMEGMTCETGRIQAKSVSFVFLEDPNLADLNISPLSNPSFRGEQRIHQPYDVICGEDVLTQLHQVDDQILIMPWSNSSQYLILEKPLSQEQIRKLQTQLKDMKFSSQDPNGILDKETLTAISLYASYRNEDKDAPRFLRTAISENLLDGLGVLTDE